MARAMLKCVITATCHDSAAVDPLQSAATRPFLFSRWGSYSPVIRNQRARLFRRTVALSDPMNQAALIEVLRTYDTALRENGATGLFMFGSRALGIPRPDSDLDLFIDYDPEAKVPNMFRLMQIEEELSRALGIPVTITTRNALHPLMRESIERDAIRVS